MRTLFLNGTVVSPDLTRRGFCAGLAVLPAALSASPADAATDFNGAIGWRDATSGLAEARRLGKPVFMVVHANWCPACRKYSRVFRDPAVVEKLRAFVPILVDSDRDATEKQFKPDGGYVPRSMILSPEGELFGDITGPYKSRFFLPPEDPDYLVGFLDRGLARAGVPAAVPAQPVRRTAPGAGSDSASLIRPEQAGGGTGGPKRLRAPGTTAGPAESAAADPQAPGLVERIISVLF